MSNNQTRLLITGASGFIGSSLCKHLYPEYHITTALRKLTSSTPVSHRQIVVGNISPLTDWSSLLQEISIVIHLAGRAHILNETTDDPLKVFRENNTYSAINLARQASKAGVRRFIFISSIGVNGNQTTENPFSVNDKPAPVEPYALSKYEAEIGLQKIANHTNMELVVIRPPLVYGVNAPGNFGRLFRVVAQGIFLPLGAIHNKRSLVALPNLIDLIKTCIMHPKAAGQTFLVSDDNDVSTTELLKMIAKSLDKPSRLLPIPASLLTLGATIFGKRAIVRRLCGSLQVEIGHTKNTLGWVPPVKVNEGLQEIAEAYLEYLEEQGLG